MELNKQQETFLKDLMATANVLSSMQHDITSMQQYVITRNYVPDTEMLAFVHYLEGELEGWRSCLFDRDTHAEATSRAAFNKNI